MKAAQIKEYGSAGNITVTETSKPEPAAGQVLVAIKAASLNPFDVTVREGRVNKNGILAKPLTLGDDFAGVVEAVGQNVSDFKTGDKVFGSAITLAGGSGSLAEYAVVPVRKLALAPKNLDFVQAASLPLVGSSAIQAVYEHMKLKSDDKLFIHGGSGGIGTIAIQIAKHAGAYVAVSDRSHHETALKTLGADEVIDTSKQDFSTELVDFQAMLNLVRGADFNKFIAILQPGGVVVSLTGKPERLADTNKDVTIIAQGTDTNAEHLETLRELVEQGIVKPVIAATFTLDQTREAFNTLESGGKLGKFVVTIP